jgi:hypothetical protein
LDLLKSELFLQYNFGADFNQEDTCLDFLIDAKERCSPRSDVAFRNMLQGMVSKKKFWLSVQLVTPSKAFSSYNLSTVCKLYDLSDGTNASLNMFPKLACGHFSSDDFEQVLKNLLEVLEYNLLAMPFDGTNEATKSIYVYFFLRAAISLFGDSAFTILPEKDIEGIHGHGLVDYAIDSRRTQRTVGVTEVKKDDFKQGVAQNAVQLESCLVSASFSITHLIKRIVI